MKVIQGLAGGGVDMMNLGVVFIPVCIVGFLIYVWFRNDSLPPNARLLFDAWDSVAQKMADDENRIQKTT